MNRTELKANYGHIIDTDKLIDTMMATYTRYGHRNTEYGICAILTTFFREKMPLINLFIKSPNYKGDLRIIKYVEVPIERAVYEAKTIVDKIINLTHVKERLVSKTDEDGKTLADYLKVGRNVFTACELTKEKLTELSGQWKAEKLINFDEYGYLKASIADERYLEYALRSLGGNADSNCTLTKEFIAYYFNNTPTKLKGKLSEGMKLSRAFQKVWSLYDLDMEKVASTINRAYKDWNVNDNKTLSQYLQTKEGKELAKKQGYDVSTVEKRKELVNLIGYQKVYNQLFAQLSDLWRTKTHKYYYVISLHPLDYFTMSFGTNWRSCHTTDPNNIRHARGDGYHGMYMNGISSYMLDGTSIITYCLDDVPETDIHEKGKVYRCMFHYKDYALVQGRLYPQGNDGKTDLYKVFRLEMQKEITAMEDDLTVNKWRKASQRLPIGVHSLGHHYRDYECFSGCNTSYPVEKAMEVESSFYDRTGEIYMTIGHNAVCPNCGVSEDPNNGIYFNNGSLVCDNCR